MKLWFPGLRRLRVAVVIGERCSAGETKKFYKCVVGRMERLEKETPFRLRELASSSAGRKGASVVC
jgi:hypothetical protein